MTDNLCESCDYWKVIHNPLGCECKARMIEPNHFLSCDLKCPEYKCEREDKTK